MMSQPWRGRVIVGLAALAGLTACGGADRSGADAESGEPAAIAVAADAFLGPDAALRRMDAGLIVLHVGSVEDFERAHLPGARHLPLEALRREVAGVPVELPPLAALDSLFEALGVGDDAPILVYGDPLPAARAFFTLDVLGHGSRVALLDGGLAGWLEAGHPVHTGSGDAPAPSPFTARVRPDRILDAAGVEARIDGQGVSLLDARPPAQYSGEQSGDRVARGGHIPGATNLFWEEMTTGDGSGRLLPEDSLRALFAAAGIAPGDTVITYCRTGMQSSFAYAVARALGYETRMYDGSMVDWTLDPDRPVAQADPAAAGRRQ